MPTPSTRRAGVVSVTALFGLAMILVLAYTAAPAWAKRLGLDVWNLPALRENVRVTEQDRATITAEQERVIREIETAGHIAARLIDGTATLAEVTTQLEPYLAVRPGFDAAWQSAYQTPTFRHGVARYAILRVERALENNPERWAVVSARLEAEYAALK